MRVNFEGEALIVGSWLFGVLQDRLKAQKEEAKNNPEYGSTFKTAATKEEKAAKRKQILATIGTPYNRLYLEYG